jgi:hypothetical protein
MNPKLIPVSVGHARFEGETRKCIFLAGHESFASSRHTSWTDKFTFWAYEEPVAQTKKISLWFVDKSFDGEYVALADSRRARIGHRVGLDSSDKPLRPSRQDSPTSKSSLPNQAILTGTSSRLPARTEKRSVRTVSYSRC